MRAMKYEADILDNATKLVLRRRTEYVKDMIDGRTVCISEHYFFVVARNNRVTFVCITLHILLDFVLRLNRNYERDIV